MSWQPPEMRRVLANLIQMHTRGKLINSLKYLTLCDRPHTKCIHLSSGTNVSSSDRSAGVVARGVEEKTNSYKKKKRVKSKRITKVPKRDEVAYSNATPPGDKKDTKCCLPTAYSPQYVEAAWYPWWEKMGFFSADFKSQIGESSTNSEYFSLCLPPPNVTGTLHIGHALGNSIQDSIVRWNRMCGRQTLWNPGCDHAGIATQVVVEKELWKKQRKTRHDFGRDKFIEEIWKWKNEKGEVIYDQMKQMGLSLDWSRACFTLDPKLSHAVTEAFVRLHDEGLIFRSNRIVNWSCALKSTISDAEVEEQYVGGKTCLDLPGYDDKVNFGLLTSFAYPLENSGQKIEVSTTRPETMLGDVAIAVHPEDERFKHFHGKYAIHPLTSRRMPIVLDHSVKRDFGTGAVKITPAHDHNDYEIAVRHNLDILEVIDDEGNMTNVPQHFLGMKRYLAREAVISALNDIGLLQEIEDHPMVIPMCSRSKDVVEPKVKEQWFVDCKDMAERAAEVVFNKELILIPDSYEKQWFDRLNRIKDWCISRQLWWGHRIPAYRVILKSGQPVNGKTAWFSAHSHEEALVKAISHLGLPAEEINLQQDEDVLDTWFSSALFPFSIFGWPDKTKDLHHFYPTTMLETASDILFVWVIRMVMLGEKLTGQLPFKQVLLHKIVRDRHGRKMSKSLGNVIDPLDIIFGSPLEHLQLKVENSNLSENEVEHALKVQRKDYPMGIPQCGADALRFTLCSYNFTGSLDKLFQDDVLEENRRTLFLKNLPEDLSEEQLKNAIPAVKEVKTGKKGGFVYLVFENEDEADEQFEMLEGCRLWDRDLKVDFVGEKSVSQNVGKRLWGVGYSVNVDVADIETTRRFCNKVWQGFRFCQNYWPQDFLPIPPHCLDTDHLYPTDQWILSRLSKLVSDFNSNFQVHALDKATAAFKTFWKDDFCDIYLEYCKPVLNSQDASRVFVIQSVLYACLHTALRCLSPFMPFLTEELFQRLPRAVGDHMPSICIAPFPQPDQYPWHNTEVEHEMTTVQDVVMTARTTRDIFLLTKARAHVTVVCQNSKLATALQKHHDALVALSRSASVSITQGPAPSGDYFHTDISDIGVLYMDLTGLVDDELLLKLMTTRNKVEDSLHNYLKEMESDPSFESQVKTEEAHLETLDNAINIVNTLKSRH